MKKALVLALLAAPLLHGQTVKQVTDRRSSSFAQLSILLELPKVKNGDVAASRVRVTSATDDTGRSLVPDPGDEPRFDSNQRMGPPDPEVAARPATVNVELKSPDRKATRVKDVRGEIELYMPSKDANSVAEVAKFPTLTGKVSHRALAANGVEITVLTPAQIKELGDSVSVDEGDLLVRVKDPNKRMQELEYVMGDGETKPATARTDPDTGLTTISTWGKLQPDWKLRVSMKTPKNVVKQAFAIADVALP